MAPNFVQKSTKGDIDFEKAREGKWTILFSHPRYRTPICTTELSEVAKLKATWEKLGVNVFAVSVDSVSHNVEWESEIAKFGGAEIYYPIISDEDYAVSKLYGMLNQDHIDGGMPLTVRSVFFISPAGKIETILTYPASVGRNFAEIVRTVEALQTVSEHKVACPVNWVKGADVVIPPFVSNDEAEKLFGKENINTVFPYLRFTKDPSTKQ
eukprot:UN02572